MPSEALEGLIGIYKFSGCSGAPRVLKGQLATRPELLQRSTLCPQPSWHVPRESLWGKLIMSYPGQLG